MADRPILFSAPMIRALLDGRKMQTRRVLKPAPFIDPMGNFCAPDRKGKIWNWGQHTDGRPCTRNYEKKHVRFVTGDRLWAREACAIDGDRVFYRLGHEEDAARGPRVDVRWRPSIHMPRWASRLTLIVTDVRVQRLQDISEEDAIAEGVVAAPVAAPDGMAIARYIVPGVEHPNKDFPELSRVTAREMYAALWDTINGPGAWDANPWVVAVSFETHRCNIDQMEVGDAR